ncbi:hypothetical protein EYF80_017608 [Liparis tanakae]|uniref:Uncharacterized protein n=1 Tax=Liparis tanakae TaxID=230148 RepID=A0A4Z2I2X5_9TELE|nr:hypothetical protein EYF80_017608 [Liparis tanakae]
MGGGVNVCLECLRVQQTKVHSDHLTNSCNPQLLRTQEDLVHHTTFHQKRMSTSKNIQHAAGNRDAIPQLDIHV